MKKLLGERGPQNMDEVGGVFEQFSLNRSAKIIPRFSVSLNVFRTRELQLMIYIILITISLPSLLIYFLIGTVLIGTSNNEECGGEGVL